MLGTQLPESAHTVWEDLQAAGYDYKLTVYFNREYGELFDLREDPNEIHNRWNDRSHAKLNPDLLTNMIFAEMDKEPMPMPRVANA